MNRTKISGVDKSLSGQRMSWDKIKKIYPDHCIYFSDPIFDENFGVCLDHATVVFHGASEVGNEEGTEFYKSLHHSGVKVSRECTIVHGVVI